VYAGAATAAVDAATPAVPLTAALAAAAHGGGGGGLGGPLLDMAGLATALPAAAGDTAAGTLFAMPAAGLLGGRGCGLSAALQAGAGADAHVLSADGYLSALLAGGQQPGTPLLQLQPQAQAPGLGLDPAPLSLAGCGAAAAAAESGPCGWALAPAALLAAGSGRQPGAHALLASRAGAPAVAPQAAVCLPYTFIQGGGGACGAALGPGVVATPALRLQLPAHTLQLLQNSAP
jgi:hypothetical protein